MDYDIRLTSGAISDSRTKLDANTDTDAHTKDVEVAQTFLVSSADIGTDTSGHQNSNVQAADDTKASQQLDKQVETGENGVSVLVRAPVDAPPLEVGDGEPGAGPCDPPSPALRRVRVASAEPQLA